MQFCSLPEHHYCPIPRYARDRSREVGRILGALIILFSASTISPLSAASLPAGFTETQIASGLSNSTAMTFAPDGRLFVCLQGGQLRVIKNGALLSTPFLNVTVNSSGERGLLGVAFDPNFITNHYVYIYYTATSPAIHNRVSRFTANGDVALPGSEVVVFELNNLSSATNHNGGAIHFGPDGKLYVAVGENANPSNSQTLANLLGKILCLNADGSIPTDNPFYGSATADNRAIWALGLRNPYTFAFQPGTARMFINDVGQSASEEINDGLAGSNYGWPTCEGACSPPNPSFRDPLFQYGHGSSASTGCAITGGAFYNPSTQQFPSDYSSKYFFADFCTGWIRRFDPATNTATDFAAGVSSPVDLQVASDGSLYYLARGSGAVYRIQYPANLARTFQFSASSYSVGESANSALITVTRSGDNSSPATVDYATSNGSASDRSDYTATASTLVFTPGETSQTFNVLITDDAYVEGVETVNIVLSNPTGGLAVGTPSSAVLTINDNDTVAPTSNPADDARFFVRQHYSDFLSRLPDQKGLDYWTDQITQCGQDSLCVHQHRIGVSAAFFFEAEFQETGSFIYRVFKGALGRQPTFAEFSSDRTRVAAGSDPQASKTAFLAEFTQRAAFKSAYPDTMTNSEFVNGLFDTAGLTPFATERQQQIDAMDAGKTRAQVVGDVIEMQTFKDREFNPSFVLMQYFGYLVRDPDPAGYQHWLDVLNNRVPGNFRSMVCAFITSFEYQDRFSPVRTRHNQDCAR